MDTDERIDIIFTTYTGKQLTHNDRLKLTENIFYVFRHLSDLPELEHTRRNIYNRLARDDAVVTMALIRTDDGYRIVGFIMAAAVDEFPNLLHIYYLLTAPQFRNIGIAMNLLSSLYTFARTNRYKLISLVFDTRNQQLTQFYFKNKYYFDESFRSYKQYDMLVRLIESSE